MAKAKIVVAHPGGGVPMWLARCLYDRRLSAEDTDGRMSVFEVTAPPHVLIAPSHCHSICDELLIVLEGMVISFTNLDKEDHCLLAGEFIFLPKDTVEGFRTEELPARMMWIMSPSGNSDEFFDIVSERASCHSLPPPEYKVPTIEVLRKESINTGFQTVL